MTQQPNYVIAGPWAASYGIAIYAVTVKPNLRGYETDRAANSIVDDKVSVRPVKQNGICACLVKPARVSASRSTWLSGRASACRAEGRGFDSRRRRSGEQPGE